MAGMITARASERPQPSHKTGGRPVGPQSAKVAHVEGLIEALIALRGTEAFEGAHEKAECAILIARRANRRARAQRKITQTQLFALQERLDNAEEKIVLAMREHRMRLRDVVIPDVQANYRMAEALA